MLNIAHIRGFSGPDDPSLLNPSYKTLHRIILETFGEPLWRYHDELELLEAFCAIVEAHQFLCERGIVHRDISAGNLLLWRGGPVKGFITDFAVAHVDDSLIGHLTMQKAVHPIQKGIDRSSGKPIMTPGSVSTKIDYTSSRAHGLPITGTLQFMAIPLLDAIAAGRKTRLAHTPSHDLESIIYVLGYTVLRRLVSTAGCPGSLEKVFKRCFGQETVDDIISMRESQQPLSWYFKRGDDQAKIGHIHNHMSDIMCKLFEKLQVRLRGVKKRFQAEGADAVPARVPQFAALTHDMLLKPLRWAIDAFKAKPSLMVRFDPNEALRPFSTT
ncbi:NAD-binding protein [Fomitopsis schrenkii]|uniref:NAD-binding protein n=1 Tax=Fomitopsis schrenkii TaxID=2126942 RepID=S8DKD1_FOMSC|nr:NAD-binding protein [Fomitopsis schrenkii]